MLRKKAQEMSSKNLNTYIIFIRVALVVSFIAIILSLILLCKHTGICTSSFGCSINGVDACAELGKSSYSKIAFLGFHFPIAWLGLLYYTIIFSLFLRLHQTSKKASSHSLNIIFALASFGFVFDLFLAYRNFFVLLNPCLLCVYTYICQFAILSSTFWIYFSPFNKEANPSLAKLWEESKNEKLTFLFSIVFALIVGFGFSYMGDTEEDHSHHNHNNNHQHNFKLLEKSEVSSILRELNSLKEIKLEESKLRSFEGNKGAYVHIHEWLDFRCPHCRVGSEVLQSALQRWPGRVKIFYRNFPLDGNCNPLMAKRKSPGAPSCKAAQAALCTTQYDYHSAFVKGIFNFQRSQTQITYESLRTLLESLGGKWAPVSACMPSKKVKQKLLFDVKVAEKIKISATPTIILNNRLLPAGVPNKRWLFKVIDALVLDKEGENAIQDFQARH